MAAVGLAIQDVASAISETEPAWEKSYPATGQTAELIPAELLPRPAPDENTSAKAAPDSARTALDQRLEVAAPEPLVRRVALATQQASLQALQEWEGYVISIGEATFHARLFDKTHRSEVEEEEGEFLIEDLSEADRRLLAEGAIFRWVIGYLRDVGGSKRRVSQIVFRRLPAWTKHDLLSIKTRSSEIVKGLAWTD